eukprot:CCRYP_007952-RA/>CCRYP_007952-RA protein AED:0.00 eAED:0.00 QI:160/1/1/1/1/1/2/163/737
MPTSSLVQRHKRKSESIRISRMSTASSATSRQRRQDRPIEIIEIESSSSSSESDDRKQRKSDEDKRWCGKDIKVQETAARPSQAKLHAETPPSKEPPPFLTALFSMLKDPALSTLISWTVPSQNESKRHGGGIANRGKIVVHNPDRLQEKALKKYFATCSFDSFCRKMSRFGFEKRPHYCAEGKLRACSYVHEKLGVEMRTLLELNSLQTGEECSLIPLTRERRLNKRKRERSYDDVEKIVVVRKDAPLESYIDIEDNEDYQNQISAPLRQESSMVVLSNNLMGVSPTINMPLEILDPDCIWSSAKIIKVSNIKSSQTCHVKVRYEGWGSEWDEELPYPNTRLARIFTYTKRVKCLAALLSKKKDIRGVNASAAAAPNIIRNWTDIWPCTVSFRMPHPGPRKDTDDDKKLSPEELLRLESNVFVQPYAPHLLSSFLQKRLTWGGWWITTSHLRLWKDFDTSNPTLSSDEGGCVLRELSSSETSSQDIEYQFSKGFLEAYRVARADKWVRGCLPPKVTLEGSLTDRKYRVFNIGGDAIGGIKYTGAFDMQNASKKRISEASSQSSSPFVTQTLEKMSHLQSIPESPFLRSPTTISYERPGVRRLQSSNRWASILKIAGNEVFLGSFTSQTEAVHARKLAMAQSASKCNKLNWPHQGSTIEFQASTGPIVDLLSTPIEAVIFSFEESQRNKSSFCLNDWVVDNEKQLSPQPLSCGMMTPLASQQRKQSAPKRKRVDCTR